MIAFENRQQKYRQQGRKQACGPAADLSAPQEDQRQELEEGVCSAGDKGGGNTALTSLGVMRLVQKPAVLGGHGGGKDSFQNSFF